MSACPECAQEIQAGNHRCACGGYYYHEWKGGGVLQCPSGTWRWWSEECRWQQLEMPVAPKVELVPQAPFAAFTVAGTSAEVTVTVTIDSQGYTA